VPELLKRLKIGNLEFESCLVQAALSGYSDWPMRQISREMKAAYTIHEVMLEKFVVIAGNGKRNQHHFKVTENEHPVGAQLMGSEPEQFGPAAIRLVESGFDLIDLNFACPAKKVSGRCRGGYLLSQPEVALKIVSQVRSRLPESIPLTVKMRRAFDDTAESEDQFFKIFHGAFERGVAAITVHGRYVVQKYKGPSDWLFLQKLKKDHPTRTLLGSGDLFTASDCVDMLRITGMDGISIARGAIGNPWIFPQTLALLRGKNMPEPPTVKEQKKIIQKHLNYCLQMYDPKKASTLMRKFGIYYSRLHPESERMKEKFIAVNSLEKFVTVLDKCYSSEEAGCYPVFPEMNPLASRATDIVGLV
jgi:tRNA-dihydrouridine synthase B